MGIEYDCLVGYQCFINAVSPIVEQFLKVLEESGRSARVLGFASELGKLLEVPSR